MRVSGTGTGRGRQSMTLFASGSAQSVASAAKEFLRGMLLDSGVVFNVGKTAGLRE